MNLIVSKMADAVVEAKQGEENVTEEEMAAAGEEAAEEAAAEEAAEA